MKTPPRRPARGPRRSTSAASPAQVKSALKGKAPGRSPITLSTKPFKVEEPLTKTAPPAQAATATAPKVSSRSWYSTVARKLKLKQRVISQQTRARRPLWLRALFFPFTNPFFRYSILCCFLIGLVGLVYIMRDLPSPRRLTSKDNYAVSTIIFDRNNTPLYEIFADEHRIPIKLADLPPHVYQASIAIEDKHFYSHFGFDITGITRAISNNLQGKTIEGGSTITQQLVKNALLSKEKTLTRKAKEGVLAVLTEVIYTKDEILEMYLNYISYGGTSVGVEAAAQRYFNKSAKDLTLAEAALLAGLPQAPSRYSPFGSNPMEAKNRQAEVLRRMVEDNYISPLQAEAAKAEVLTYALSKTDIQAPHFVFYVRDLLYQKYGVETVEKGGLRVKTSLDLTIQHVAQASLSAQVDQLERYDISNGAAIIVRPPTGEILAMIGSRDYFDTDGQVNVTLAERQPGSSIKPLMYATTFQEKQLNPGSVLLDIPTCFTVPGQKPYCPKNYDGSFRGPVNIRQSLGNSLNIPAVKALRTIGVETFIRQATKLGITSWVDPSRYGLSLTLGGGEVRMIDLAQAFGTIANQGVKVPLTPILSIEDYQGNLLEKVDVDARRAQLADLTTYDAESQEGDLQRVMDRAPAYLTAHIMQDNNARTAAFGPRSKLVIPNQVVSAKTGTTNDLKDNWTVGFTPELLVITWVGNNDGSPMNPYLVSGITGAAPIFYDIMTQLLKGQEPVLPEKPPDVMSGMVCVHGLPPRPGETCAANGPELYWKDGLPSRSNQYTKEIWIKPDTGLPPSPGEVVDGLVLQTRTVFQDPMTEQYCADCNRPVNDQGKVEYEKNTVDSSYQIQSTSESSQTQTERTQ